jgi:hypothetical protein
VLTTVKGTLLLALRQEVVNTNKFNIGAQSFCNWLTYGSMDLSRYSTLEGLSQAFPYCNPTAEVDLYIKDICPSVFLKWTQNMNDSKHNAYLT